MGSTRTVIAKLMASVSAFVLCAGDAAASRGTLQEAVPLRGDAAAKPTTAELSAERHGDPEAGARIVLGLFIGIGKYPEESGWASHSVHLTNLRRLVPLLEKQWGVVWQQPPLVDGAATRDGVRESLSRLLDQVSRRRDNDESVKVVLFFTGHGSQVRDQKEESDETDGLDETWTTVESRLKCGRGDIRDDDLDAFTRRLRQLGADVMVITESCHSESSTRGSQLEVLGGGDPGRFARGPETRLFEGAEWDEFYARNPAVVPDRGWMIHLAACRDEQLARFRPVLVDGELEAWGDFSRALWATVHRLAVAGPYSYAELHHGIQARFDGRIGSLTQLPTVTFEPPIAIDQGVRDGKELLAGVRVVDVRRDETTGRPQLKIDAGIEAAYWPESTVEIRRGEEWCCRGTVVEAAWHTAWIAPDVADAEEWKELRVLPPKDQIGEGRPHLWIGGGVANRLRDGLEGDPRFVVLPEADGADLVIRADDDRRVGAFVEGVPALAGLELCSMPPTFDADDDRRFRDGLILIDRVARLMVPGDETEGAKIVRVLRGAPPLDQGEIVDGVEVMHETKYSLEVENRFGDRALFLAILEVTIPDGGYPVASLLVVNRPIPKNDQKSISLTLRLPGEVDREQVIQLAIISARRLRAELLMHRFGVGMTTDRGSGTVRPSSIGSPGVWEEEQGDRGGGAKPADPVFTMVSPVVFSIAREAEAAVQP